jgi:hypothetical protein
LRRRARRTSKPPESRTIADAADAPSISGVTAKPANANLDAPTNNKPKPTNFDMITPLAGRYSLLPGCAYFLRRVRKISKPPESRAIAELADAPSISGAAIAVAEAKLAAPISNKLKPRSLYTILSSDSF